MLNYSVGKATVSISEKEEIRMRYDAKTDYMTTILQLDVSDLDDSTITKIAG